MWEDLPAIIDQENTFASWGPSGPRYMGSGFVGFSSYLSYLNADGLPVQKKYDDAWKYGTKPTIKKIYKVIESKTFLLPYDKYKLVTSVAFRYYYILNFIILFPGRRSVETLKFSDTTALRGGANLGRMETPCFATTVAVRYVAFSGRLSGQLSLIRTERECFAIIPCYL